jgi:hypothetical protein
VDADEGLLDLLGACALALAQSRCPAPRQQRELGPESAKLADLSIAAMGA